MLANRGLSLKSFSYSLIGIEREVNITKGESEIFVDVKYEVSKVVCFFMMQNTLAE